MCVRSRVCVCACLCVCSRASTRTVRIRCGYLGDAVTCRTFDGDSTAGERADVLENANLVLTNPDMLHCTVIPNHRAWWRFLANLRFVVLDEAHTSVGILFVLFVLGGELIYT